MVGLARLRPAQILHRERHAAERAVGQRGVLGARERALERRMDERAEPRVPRLVAPDRRAHELAGGELAAPNELGLVGGVAIQELVGHGHLRPPTVSRGGGGRRPCCAARNAVE